MKPSKTIAPLFLFFSLCLLPLISQDSLQFRKLYLHTDRDQYFLGDTLWYKAYYLNGQTNKFIPGLVTLYIELINESGTSVLDQVVAIDNGSADGVIDILPSLSQGNYMLRAFTDFQRSMGEDAFFYKRIEIAKLESFVESEVQPDTLGLQDIDVAFLPEGGTLLEGLENTVGIKAIDQDGFGVPVNGRIKNSKGETIASFTSQYKGMTVVHFIPEKGETYSVHIEGTPEFSYEFDSIVEEGIKIEFLGETSDDIDFQVVTNSESLEKRTYYLAVSHQGEIVYNKKFMLEGSEIHFAFNKSELQAGINRFVLLNEQMIPLSERLYFSRNYQINELEITADKPDYETRSRVILNITDDMDMDIRSWSNLSMAVVDDLGLKLSNQSSNILSWLLIDSELKGYIETPLDFFKDDSVISSTDKLDLLMATQGWNSYIWENYEEIVGKKTVEEEGFSLSGAVSKKIGEKSATEGTVELRIYNNQFMYTDTVDIGRDGRFTFKDISFMDTAYVFIQAKNKRGNLAFELKLDTLFDEFPAISNAYLPEGRSKYPKNAELYQKQYDNLQALKEYTLRTGSFYLDEVSVTAHRRERDDGEFRIYPRPENTQEITERDLTYPNIIEYLSGHFSGVTVLDNTYVIVRGLNSFGGPKDSQALLLLDGLPVRAELLKSIPMSDIDKVEVLKNASETAIFGVNGANGVVSVFTKKGTVTIDSDKYLPGTIAKKLRGYSENRQFYLPRYTPESVQSEKPDHRMLLYWNPNIYTKSWEAEVSFYTSDDLSRYRVFVEGLTRDGEVCLGTTTFDVNQKK